MIKNKCLVLGSSGQIGKHLVNFLKKNNNDVIEFDIVDDVTQDLRLFNNLYLEEKIQECDFVYFLAFDVGGARYLKEQQNNFNFIQNNSKIMCNTFEALKKHNKPFIFTSTQMSSMDYSSYGTLKKIGEYYTKSLNGLVVRLWNVYGVETDPEKTHVITDFINKALVNKKIDMITDGNEERQFLYVEDCCECLLKLKDIYYQINRNTEYHVSSFEWTKIKDLSDIIAQLIPCEIVYGKEKDDVQKNLKNNPNADILKYWKPKTALKEGIEKMIEYYRGKNV
jgi:nucleoside-diphosphate-sugar epimerase